MKTKSLILVVILLLVSGCSQTHFTDTPEAAGTSDPRLAKMEEPKTSAFSDLRISKEAQAAAINYSSPGGTSNSARSKDAYPYSKMGPYATKTTNHKRYLIYHPRDLSKVTGKMPILTWSNPSFFDSWCFYKLLHLAASYGMVVVASHDVMTGTGKEAIGGIDLMIAENENPQSQFYQRLDTEAIGAFGHSQGGVGTLNAFYADPRIKTAAPLHPGLDVLLQKDYTRKPTENAPMLMLTGQFDVFAPPSYNERTVYDRQLGTTIYGVRKGVSHYGPVSVLGGDSSVEHYVTAWFLLQLTNRTELESEFFGPNCHICSDKNYETKSK